MRLSYLPDLIIARFTRGKAPSGCACAAMIAVGFVCLLERVVLYLCALEWLTFIMDLQCNKAAERERK